MDPRTILLLILVVSSFLGAAHRHLLSHRQADQENRLETLELESLERKLEAQDPTPCGPPSPTALYFILTPARELCRDFS